MSNWVPVSPVPLIFKSTLAQKSSRGFVFSSKYFYTACAHRDFLTLRYLDPEVGTKASPGWLLHSRQQGDLNYLSRHFLRNRLLLLTGQCCLMVSSQFLIRFTYCLCRGIFLPIFISHFIIITERWELPYFTRYQSIYWKAPQCHTSGLGHVT